jgi:Family of unknown function (DUF6505)
MIHAVTICRRPRGFLPATTTDIASRHAGVYDQSMRFPRIIRLDDSDSRVYDKLAVPGEWAVPGSFMFIDIDPDSLNGGQRQAFSHGFLGTASFGWGTLVMVDEISEREYREVVECLADRFMRDYGAPDRESALAAAREEAEFAASLCEHEINTLLAMERSIEDASIVESFRVVSPPNAIDHTALKLWAVEED